VTGNALPARISPPSRFALRFIETYRTFVGPEIDARCRFEPSCSAYGFEAYRKFGFVKATHKTLGRLSRCRKRYEGPFVDAP
jgi:hypothetical protein